MYVESEIGTLPQHLHVLFFTIALLLPPAARWRWPTPLTPLSRQAAASAAKLAAPLTPRSR